MGRNYAYSIVWCQHLTQWPGRTKSCGKNILPHLTYFEIPAYQKAQNLTCIRSQINISSAYVRLLRLFTKKLKREMIKLEHSPNTCKFTRMFENNVHNRRRVEKNTCFNLFIVFTTIAKQGRALGNLTNGSLSVTPWQHYSSLYL